MPQILGAEKRVRLVRSNLLVGSNLLELSFLRSLKLRSILREGAVMITSPGCAMGAKWL